jgi:hypothetical protein
MVSGFIDANKHEKVKPSLCSSTMPWKYMRRGWKCEYILARRLGGP